MFCIIYFFTMIHLVTIRLMNKKNAYIWIRNPQLHHQTLIQMKILVNKTLFVSLFLGAMLFACEKEKPTEVLLPEEEQAEIVLTSIGDLVSFAQERYFGGSVQAGQDDETFVISNEGLIDEYTADERGFNENRPRQNSLISCILSVEPDQEQRPLIAQALREYRMRNQRIINLHRQRFHNLSQRMEGARSQLQERFRSGDIDREQYRRQMQMLRERFQEALQNMRAAHAEAFSASYALLLERLQEIFSEEQWEAFAACLMSE